jgi:hypothetical protein
VNANFDVVAFSQRGASNMKATVKEKVAHASADAVGKKLTHPTNPAVKMAATQEVSMDLTVFLVSEVRF